MSVTTPRRVDPPRHVLRALLVVTTWFKGARYSVKIFKSAPERTKK